MAENYSRKILHETLMTYNYALYSSAYFNGVMVTRVHCVYTQNKMS